MSSRQTRPTPPESTRPAVDEWGIYDPSQAGLEALFERLDKRRAAADPDAQAVAQSMQDANRLAKGDDKK